jgi:hypothetical protein
MFESMKEHPDLIFSDACVQLFPIDVDLHSFLGSDIIEIIHKTDPRICNGAKPSAHLLNHSMSILYVAFLFLFYLFS